MRTNKAKLVSLDDECWRILEQESGPRMQSVYVRSAIKHYYKWRNAGSSIPLVKVSDEVRRYDANTINMRILELQELLDAQTDRWNEELVQRKKLEKQLQETNSWGNGIPTQRIQKKWWHFFAAVLWGRK